MALTPQDVTDFLVANGIDDPAKLPVVLGPALVAAKLRQVEEELEAVRGRQAAAAVPFNDQIRPIEAQRAEAVRAFQPQIDALLGQVAALKARL